MAPAVTTPFCLDAQPEEDLVVLSVRGDGSGAGGCTDWLRRALAFSEFVCMSRAPDHSLSVVVGESFLKKVELPESVKVEGQWAALRLDKAVLDPRAAAGSFAALCRTLREAGVEPHAVSTSDADQLLLQKQQLAA
eukprot:CAMPEP_0175774402 /NCGR_PEP_ID=MMETSP0097-20121207/73586_1 /TAXON_ID=311494 /ORGANISM="Alexandrium monilatum, Strain CCMP3105" /LENGTH=135 /DNA_ID=CAMNT_0017084865 /DNA_START=20 /DNA_END=423 /DNA_ORIENTATION=+